MRKLLFVVLACGSACVPTQVAAAVPKQEGIRSTIDVTPKNAPGLGGGYEFDLLDAVEGTACVGAADINVYTASIPGFQPTDADYLSQRAEGAALYDAMGKTQGADTLLVTWVKIVTEGEKKCATVHGRGVRLRQVDHVVTPPPAPAQPPVQAAPAAGAKPAT